MRRVEAPTPWQDIKFWVSPATLVCVESISGDLRSLSLPLQTRRLQWVGPAIPLDERRWHLEGDGFDLRFGAWNFTLYLRRLPHQGRRALRMADHGGISLEQRPFA